MQPRQFELYHNGTVLVLETTDARIDVHTLAGRRLQDVEGWEDTRKRGEAIVAALQYIMPEDCFNDMFTTMYFEAKRLIERQWNEQRAVSVLFTIPVID